jgi:hypothetical protein
MKELKHFAYATILTLVIFGILLIFLPIKEASIIFLSLALVNILTEVIFLWNKKDRY